MGGGYDRRQYAAAPRLVTGQEEGRGRADLPGTCQRQDEEEEKRLPALARVPDLVDDLDARCWTFPPLARFWARFPSVQRRPALTL